MFSGHLTCCVPGCAQTGSGLSPPDCIEVMCEAHYALASPASLARRARKEGRLRALQERWADDATFDRLVASGKYLKVCSMLSYAAEDAERAWEMVKLEVIAAAMQSRAPARQIGAARVA